MKHINQMMAGVLLLIAGNTAAVGQVLQESIPKALWMTRTIGFYRAQRSGNGPNWLIAEHEPTQTATGLSTNLTSLSRESLFKGCRHRWLRPDWQLVRLRHFEKFGQTEFYSAYMLLLGYSEFPAGYDDKYSADYQGYIGSVTTPIWEGNKGIPNGIPDILDEVKYATDFFMKCVRSNSVFYYQIGNGTTTISTGAHLLSNRLCLWPMVARLKAHACSKPPRQSSMTALYVEPHWLP